MVPEPPSAVVRAAAGSVGHGAHRRAQRIDVRIKPAPAAEHRDVDVIGNRDEPAIDEPRVGVVQERQRGAPSRGDDRQAAGQRLHQRPSPPLPARRRHVRVTGAKQGRHLRIGETLVQQHDVGPAGGRNSKLAQERVDPRLHGRGVGEDGLDLQHQRDVVVGVELPGVGLQQRSPALALLEIERRQEREAPAVGTVSPRRRGGIDRSRRCPAGSVAAARRPRRRRTPRS